MDTTYLNTNFDFNSDEFLNVSDELPFWSAPFGILLLNNIRLKKGITALDVGFGAGFPLTELAMRLGNSSKVYGIDPWDAAIRRANKKIEFYGIKNIKIIKGEAEKMPFEANSIDLITSNNGINNVSDLSRTIQECFRVLKKGGQFIQTFNLDSTMIEFYNVMEEVLVGLGMQPEITKMKAQIYSKRKPLGEVTRLIEKKGFKVLDIINDYFEYKFVDGTAMLNHYFIRLGFLDGWKEIIPKNKQETIFKSIESKVNQETVKNGFVKLSIPFVCIDCEKK